MLATEIQLLPDKTAIFQFGIFLIVALALSQFIFKPILKIIDLRRTRTEGDRTKIEELKVKSGQLLKEYEEKIKEAKAEAFKIKEIIRREGEDQGHRVVQEAKQAGLAEIEKVKQEIAAASQQALTHLETQATTLSKTLAEKVLGRSLN